MNINSVKANLNFGCSNTLKANENLNPTLNIANTDKISFSSNSTYNDYDVIKDLYDNTTQKDWKNAKKGDTKLSKIVELTHPEYGKIKIGITLDPKHFTPSSSFPGLYKAKAFIEAPKININQTSTTAENSILYKLVKNIIGQEPIDRLNNRGEAERKLSLKRFEKALADAGPEEGTTRKERALNYFA